MVFNSLEFAFFLPIVYLLYVAIHRREGLRDVFLLCASYIFYMSWYWQYAGLIALSTVTDYLVGRRLDTEVDEGKRKFLLFVSIFVNLGILGIFKYFNFFSELSSQTFAFLNIDIEPFYHQLLLPVGISFYTFQTLSYTIDVYRRKIGHEGSLLKFSVFVAFLPQLVAGPIVRARDFLPQVNRVITLTTENLHKGTVLIFMGLFKKIVIADLLAFIAVDRVFANPSSYSSLDLLMALYAYAMQIYCDFSGYSDIAIGTALLLGFHININFNRPYLAVSPSDFWRRWHISLSSWLRDYLYISLGGNRGSRLFTLRNLMLTMLLGGLWHGAAMNFILWGAFHGLLLVVYNMLHVDDNPARNRILRIAVMFHLVLFGWLLFRVNDMNNFQEYCRGLADMSMGTVFGPFFYTLLVFAFLMHFVPARFTRDVCLQAIPGLPVVLQASIYAGSLLLFVGLSLTEPAFIYFQF